MNDISDYIQGELIKTPFNLYNLIAKYIESNNNTKVAFVGGYLRDLLIPESLFLFQKQEHQFLILVKIF